jgi:hypothetical protein
LVCRGEWYKTDKRNLWKKDASANKICSTEGAAILESIAMKAVVSSGKRCDQKKRKEKEIWQPMTKPNFGCSPCTYIHTHTHTHTHISLHRYTNSVIQQSHMKIVRKKHITHKQNKRTQYNSVNKCQYYSLQNKILWNNIMIINWYNTNCNIK